MVEINWPDRGQRKLIVDTGEEGHRIVTLKQLERSKASIVAGVVSCCKCKMECDLEIPSLGAKIDEEIIKSSRLLLAALGLTVPEKVEF
ncbi:hypothetical protein L3X38_037193 [Prunus dulcis]|uniref:Uncharacterized protein n=1 Tax=Prunus dulcis TaxID=3755 RepID=A0AAD4V467_PRUDU|nr:hypothetical protein L3X38_037193 [Prunus dulcis]